jgi:predicted ferric reductase
VASARIPADVTARTLQFTLAPGEVRRAGDTSGGSMLYTIFVVLVVLWLLGVATAYTLNGFIHLLLVIAVAVVLIRIIQGRRPI